MATTTRGGPDLSKCFGQYRQQSVQYALQHCLECRKLKACVRTTWGIAEPGRPRRDSYRSGKQQGRGRRPPWPSAQESLAT